MKSTFLSSGAEIFLGMLPEMELVGTLCLLLVFEMTESQFHLS